VLSAGKLLSSTLPTDVPEVLACLAVDTCMVNLVRPDKAGDLASGMGSTTEHHEWSYGVDYTAGTLPAEAIGAWRAALAGSNAAAHEAGLALPKKNVFIADDFKLVAPAPGVGLDLGLGAAAPACGAVPVVAAETARGTLWHHVDTSFKQPRTHASALVICPALVENQDKRRLLVRLINDTLAVHTYDAAVAGLHFSVTSSRQGLKISVHGFSQKLLRLLEVVVSGIREPNFDPAVFNAAKERTVRLLQNWSVARPDSHAMEYGRPCPCGAPRCRQDAPLFGGDRDPVCTRTKRQ